MPARSGGEGHEVEKQGTGRELCRGPRCLGRPLCILGHRCGRPGAGRGGRWVSLAVEPASLCVISPPPYCPSRNSGRVYRIQVTNSNRGSKIRNLGTKSYLSLGLTKMNFFSKRSHLRPSQTFPLGSDNLIYFIFSFLLVHPTQGAGFLQNFTLLGTSRENCNKHQPRAECFLPELSCTQSPPATIWRRTQLLPNIHPIGRPRP